MNFHIFIQIFLLVFTVVSENFVNSQEPPFFLKTSKSVPRIGRRSRTQDDFENFFLKASKSVPRIGRRNFDQLPDYYLPQDPQFVNKKGANHFKEVPWAEIANMVEYYPEIMLMSPPMWADGAFRDNYQFEDFGKRRLPEMDLNPTGNAPEIPEYRKQPIP